MSEALTNIEKFPDCGSKNIGGPGSPLAPYIYAPGLCTHAPNGILNGRLNQNTFHEWCLGHNTTRYHCEFEFYPIAWTIALYRLYIVHNVVALFLFTLYFPASYRYMYRLIGP